LILFKAEYGVTLLEILLVLAIISSILLMGTNQYVGYQNQRDIAAVQYNVDQLFLAAAQYYKANCNGTYSSAGVLIPGTLNPANLTPPNLTSPFSVTTAQLITAGYLSGWNPANPLIDSTVPGLDYIVQFNPIVSSGVAVSIPSSWNSGGLTFIPGTQAKTLLWRIQVSVLLRDPTRSTFYQGAMNADCISGLNGTVVDQCNPVPAAAGYLAWERLPSYASPKMSSPLTSSMPLVKEFNLQYTHDQMYELNLGNTAVQYYLCGG
jgi:prepilin-type N-terminal cleavage/methylation domain-containing protein